jgi:hypothetical protein
VSPKSKRMRNFDLQIIWSASTDYAIPGFLALHVHLESERTTIPLEEIVEKWFSQIEPEEKYAVSFVHLN